MWSVSKLFKNNPHDYISLQNFYNLILSRAKSGTDPEQDSKETKKDRGREKTKRSDSSSSDSR